MCVTFVKKWLSPPDNCKLLPTPQETYDLNLSEFTARNLSFRTPTSIFGAKELYNPGLLPSHQRGGPISWKSRRQDNVSLSTSEAEFVATRQPGQEAIYLRETLTDFGFSQTKTTLLYEDNLACVAMSKNLVRLKFSRHIDIRKYYVRELVLNGFLKLVCACTKWWLMPSPKACRPRLSSGTARS